MKAGVLHGQEDLRYEEIDMPKAKAGEVLIKVKYTGICGSDVPRVNADGAHFYPIILGHEFSGTVADVGAGVTKLKKGQRVAGAPLVPCMECEDCKKGDYALCKNYSFIGTRQPGSFAEYVAVPEFCAVPYADDVSFEKGALFEPATVALHGLERVPFQGGKNVAIIGAGTIGIMLMQFAMIYGAKQAVVFDIADQRLELAKKYGATAGVNTSKPDFMKEAMELTEGRGFDYVYEICGAEATIKMALNLAANKGNIVYVGKPTRNLTFTPEEWEIMYRKECMMTGSWLSFSGPFPGHEWTNTAHYFGTGQLKAEDDLVFKKIPLSKIAEGFEMYKTPGAVKGKILVDSEA